MKVSVLVSAVLITALTLAGCGGGGGTPSPTPSTITSITVSPSTALVAPEGTKEFTATDQDDKDITSSVTWSATADCGTIALNAAGTAAVYTAPSSAPSTNPVTVTATSGDVSGTASVGVFETTLTDATPKAVDTSGTTDVFPTSFNIAFSVPMADSTIVKETASSDGNITLTCNDVLKNVTVAENDSADYTYTVTVEDTDMWKYALLQCELTITTNVTDANSNAIPAAATYAFTNACAVNDDFNADSQACWTVSTNADSYTWSDYITNGIFDFNTSNSTFDYSRTDTITAGAYKEVTVDSSGFTVIIHFKSNSGVTQDDFLGLMLGGSTDVAALGEYLLVGLAPGDPEGAVLCAVVWEAGDGEEPNAHVSSDCSTADTEYYVKLTANADGITGTYSTDGSTYAALGNPEETFPVFATFLDALTTKYISLYFNDAGGATATVVDIDKVVITGATSSSQY